MMDIEPPSDQVFFDLLQQEDYRIFYSEGSYKIFHSECTEKKKVSPSSYKITARTYEGDLEEYENDESYMVYGYEIVGVLSYDSADGKWSLSLEDEYNELPPVRVLDLPSAPTLLGHIHAYIDQPD
jgi:hypothetical protein